LNHDLNICFNDLVCEQFKFSLVNGAAQKY
jgi:hypothetical protein